VCDNGCPEIDYKLKCDVCKTKPAVWLGNPDDNEETRLKAEVLCEKHGIERYGKSVVEEWAGTGLYLKKYPDQIEAWSQP
jgi:hypothetical protein